MTLHQLDIVRGYAIAVVILSLVAIGASTILPRRTGRVISTVGKIAGGCAGLTLFAILNFVAGWDEYFNAKGAGVVDYHGRHAAAARIIGSLGELNASALGIVFGLLGLTLIVSAFRSTTAPSSQD